MLFPIFAYTVYAERAVGAKVKHYNRRKQIMMWLGIVIMVLGFIGTLVFAKMRQQPPAAGCAVLMIVGLGIYMWFYLNPPPDRSGEYYAMAVAAKIAKLPEVANAKVWIASDIAGEYSKNIQEAYKAAGGKAEWKSASSPESGMMDEKVFAEIIKSCGKDDVVIVDVSVMENADTLKKMLKDANSPKFFFTNNASSFGGFSAKEIDGHFQKGKIIGMIAYQQNIDKEFKPSKSDLEEAFNKRFIVITKDNFKDNKDKIGLMEGK